MPELVLYECKHLRARLTLAACEANRAKRDIMQAQCEWKESGVRPWACNTCTDWQGWNSNNTLEGIDVQNPEKKKSFVCPECEVETLHFSKGLCRKCYQKQNRREKKAKQVVPALVAPVASVAPIAPVVPQEVALKPAMPSNVRRIYLAAPYTSPDKGVMEYRFSQATVIAGELMLQGYLVYSPLTMGHVLGKSVEMSGDWDFWQKSCLSYLEEWATDLYVLRLQGWDLSVGVTAEIEAAHMLALPVTRLLPIQRTQAVVHVARAM